MMELETKDLKSIIKEGNYILNFYSLSCETCKMLDKELKSIEKVPTIIKIQIEKYPEIGKKYRIMPIPSLIFIKDGEEIDSLPGYHIKKEIEEKLLKYGVDYE